MIKNSKTMKTTIYQLILVVCILGVFTSCNDMLDTVPQGQFTSEQIDDSSVEGLVASAYAGLEAHFYGNNEAFAGPSTNWIFDVRSDDAYKGGGGTGMEENIHLLEVSEINSDNVSCLNKWQNNYYAISRVHNAMNALADATSVSNAAQLMGELKTLRAWYYFDLIRIFNRIPYFNETDDVNTKTNDEFTRDEIFSFIKRDLTEAIEVLPAAKSPAGRITRTTAQLALSATSSDLRVGQIWEGDYELPIVVKDDTDMTFSDVASLGIASPMSMVSGGLHSTNSTVPLRQIARVAPRWSESRIMHRGGERCITVTAQFAQGVYTAPVEKEIARIMQEDILLPQGVRTEVGGEIEYGDEAMPQIIGGITIAMIIVFFFLLFNFRKYGVTTVCMVALALMIPGALIGLALMNRALGLTSIFGLITLMGMIMRNEILIFEHAIAIIDHSPLTIDHSPLTIDHSAAQKEADANNGQCSMVNVQSYNEVVKRAAYEAGKRRMVPIFLTTATTAVGVVPMIIAQSSFWMPVGVTIFAGGIGSLIMVVTMLPVVYWKVSTK